MKNEHIVGGVAGLVIGLVIAGFFAGQAVNSNNTSLMRMMNINSEKVSQRNASDHSMMSMDNMTEQLKDKNGDEYDKAFIEMMISHHEGAVAMAELSATNAKHDEIKQLSQAISTAQQKEIIEMKQWQKDWNYSSDEMMNMMHGNN